MARVVIEHLTKIFPGAEGQRICAVADLNLTVEAGELLVVVGPSGCGKTTTLRLIAGLEEPSSGSVRLDGRVVNGDPPKARDVAMVFQSPALYPHMTVYENMAFGLKLRGYPRAGIEERVKEVAAMLGLEDCLARRPMALSGGQRQRVALGRALVRRPKLFLFDEPLSNLDPPLRAQMRLELLRLHARNAATSLYVTHDQAEALTLGRRVAVLNRGVLQQIGPPLQVYQHPANLFVARFIGSPPMNLFWGVLLGQAEGLFFQEDFYEQNGSPARLFLRLEPEAATQLKDHVGRRIVLGLRPEHILAAASVPGVPPDRVIEAAVEFVEPLGAETYAHFGSGSRALVARLCGGEGVRPHHKLRLACQMGFAHFFDPATEQVIGASSTTTQN